MSCLRPLHAHSYACIRRVAPLHSGLLFKPVSRQNVLARSTKGPQTVLHWLQQLKQGEGASISDQNRLYASIIEQSDLLQLRSYSSSSASTPLASSNSEDLPAAALASSASITSTIGSASSTIKAAASAVDAVLFQQHVQLPSSFSVPSWTAVPAYQLVGIFRSMLGHPNLPQAAKATSLEAKWGLLHLTLAHAAQDEDNFQHELQQLLDTVLLPSAARKLAKVLANPKIPESNKLAAQQRHQQLYSTCWDNITSWTAFTCSTPTFQLLQPALQLVSPAMVASLAAGNHQQSPANSANSGKIMELTALQVLADILPAGWSLLSSLHLLGADGEAFVVEQGCKYEVDLLVLDGSGTAVAIVEVKLAAANPLMSLFKDVNSLLRLVDQIAGRTITAITKAEPSSSSALPLAAEAAATAASTGAASASGCAAAAEATPGAIVAAAAAGDAEIGKSQSGNSSSWEDDAAANRFIPSNSSGSSSSSSGGSSSVSHGGASGSPSSAWAKARAATATARFAEGPTWQSLSIPVHPEILPIYVLGKGIGEADIVKGLASLVDSSALKLLSKSAEDTRRSLMGEIDGKCLKQQQQQQQQQHEVARHGHCGGDSNSGHASVLAGSSHEPGALPKTRVLVSLSSDQQSTIMDQVRNRVATLERCMIYSLCAREAVATVSHCQAEPDAVIQ